MTTVLRLAFLAVFLAVPAAASPPDGDTDLICEMSRFGYSPGQISDRLQQGDGRWNPYTAGIKVQDAIVFSGDCG